jgi:hypothetical protein
MTLALSAAALAQVQVSAKADTSAPIYLGSQFTFSIIIENGDEPEKVDLAPLREFNPVGPSVQRQTSIINGRMSSSVTYSYALTPPRLGQITILPVEVTIKGKTYRTNPVSVTVTQPGQTRQMDIEIALSEPQCFVGQPVLLTVTFYVWLSLVSDKAVANVNLNIPALRSPDFLIEDADAVSFTGEQGLLPVNGQKQITIQDQVNHKGVSCLRVRFARVLIPRKPGAITIDPASVSADIVVGRKRSRNPFWDSILDQEYEYQRFGASSQPLQLEVRPLPEEGKPADFYGLVGRYTITASADPVQVSVGDPITLTLRVGGSDYLKPVQWPDLESVKGMTDDFRIPAEKSDPEIKDGQKVFTRTIRAAHEQVKEIPSVPLSFFDVQKGQYTTIRTEPIPLKVLPTRIVTGADVESRQFTSAARQIEAVREGLSANITGPEALVNQQVTLASAAMAPAMLILWAGPPALLVLSGLYKLSTRTSPQRQAARRRKNAFSVALRQIRAAEKQSNPGAALGAALKQYIADKFDKVPGSLTAGDCAALLSASAVRSDSTDNLRRMMETLEAAQYSPAGYTFSKAEKEKTIALLKEIEKQIR